jgi:hypothetical protein
MKIQAHQGMKMNLRWPKALMKLSPTNMATFIMD